MVNDAHDAYSTGSPAVRRGAAYVLALAAWQRDDVMKRCAGLAAIALLGTPLQFYALID